ncbi:MAG: hypothetical protein JJT89_09520 [Nitriliruptoraceae bacterium]|nr:hypothetical protein [Nitriliruptoraceae bacterium]
MRGRGQDPDTGEIADDAYGRVSDPQRFAPLHELARGHRDRLLTTYDVTTHAPPPEPDQGEVGVVDGWQLMPADPEASPLTFLLTNFPGLWLRFGARTAESFPACGCDACDEDVEDVAPGLASTVEAVVTGGFSESLERRGLQRTPWEITELVSATGRQRSESRIDGPRRRDLGPSHHRTYAPWPRRIAS